MGATEGDLLIPLMGEHGDVVCQPLYSPSSEDDLVIPLAATDKPVGLLVTSMTAEDETGLPGMGADETVVALTSMKELYPEVEKRCSGPGDHDYGEWIWKDPANHAKGIEIWYMYVGEYFISDVDYGKDEEIGPIVCPYGGEYCTDAIWTVTWRPREQWDWDPN